MHTRESTLSLPLREISPFVWTKRLGFFCFLFQLAKNVSKTKFCIYVSRIVIMTWVCIFQGKRTTVRWPADCHHWGVAYQMDQQNQHCSCHGSLPEEQNTKSEHWIFLTNPKTLLYYYVQNTCMWLIFMNTLFINLIFSGFPLWSTMLHVLYCISWEKRTINEVGQELF